MSHRSKHNKRSRAASRRRMHKIEERQVYTSGDTDNDPRWATAEAHATVRCPACEDREALSNEGRPRRFDHDREPLRPVSRPVPKAPDMARGCEMCGGTGQVPNPDGTKDPYDAPLRAAQVSKIVLGQAKLPPRRSEADPATGSRARRSL